MSDAIRAWIGMDGTVVAAALAVFLVAAVAQAITGFGSALVAVPLLGMVTDPVVAVVAASSAGFALAIGAWVRERRHTSNRLALRLSGCGLVGMPFGLLMLSVVSARSLTIVIGCAVLVLAGLLAARVRMPDHPLWIGGAGLVSGALLTATGISGPPLVLALQNLAPRAYRATLQAVFCLHGIFGLIGFALIGLVDRSALLLAAIGLMALPLGWTIGNRLFRLIGGEALRHVVTVGLVATAIGAIASAW